MTDAEKEKLEIAAREDAKKRKDEGRDEDEDPIENSQGQVKKDGQDEEIPAWADALVKRIDAMEKARKDESEPRAKEPEEKRPPEAADGKSRKDESEEERKHREEEDDRRERERKEEKDREDAKKRKDTEGDTDKDTDREDRARRDAQINADNRRMAARIAELESRIGAVYKEDTIENRNALAETRARADSIYQALTGQPASQPQPGESPIGYRKRMADGLRKYSTRMKDVAVDALSGEAFAVIEDHIYTDAQAAIRSDAIIPAGQLRAVVTHKHGREQTEYVGDSTATWAPFSAGAYRVGKLHRPATH